MKYLFMVKIKLRLNFSNYMTTMAFFFKNKFMSFYSNEYSKLAISYFETFWVSRINKTLIKGSIVVKQ